MAEGEFDFLREKLDKIIKKTSDYQTFIGNYRASLMNLYERKNQMREKAFETNGRNSVINAYIQRWDNLTPLEQKFMDILGFDEDDWKELDGGIQVQFMYLTDRLDSLEDALESDDAEACVYELLQKDLVVDDHLFQAYNAEGTLVMSWFQEYQELQTAAKILALVWGSRRALGKESDIPSDDYIRMFKYFDLSREFLENGMFSIEYPDDKEKKPEELEKIYQEKSAEFFWKTRSFSVVERRRQEDDISERLSDSQINSEIIAVWEMNRLIIELQQPDYIKKRLVKVLEVLNKMHEELVGLENLKNEFAKIAIQFMNGSDIENEYMNYVFEGPPGTGKTMAAEMMSELFYALGIVQNSRVVFIRREDIVAGFEGQTAQQARLELVGRGFNAVTFLDEIDTLVTDPSTDKSGKEAAEAIFRFISDMKGGRAIIIIAGYRERIDQTFFAVNRGLMRRFSSRVEFEGYESNQIIYIVAKQMVLKSAIAQYEITDETVKRIVDWIVVNEPRKVGKDDSYEEKIYESFSMFGAYAADAEKFAAAIHGQYQIAAFRGYSKGSEKIDLTPDMVDAGVEDRISSKLTSFKSFQIAHEKDDEFKDFPKSPRIERLKKDVKMKGVESEENKERYKIFTDVWKKRDSIRKKTKETKKTTTCRVDYMTDYRNEVELKESKLEEAKETKPTPQTATGNPSAKNLSGWSLKIDRTEKTDDSRFLKTIDDLEGSDSIKKKARQLAVNFIRAGTTRTRDGKPVEDYVSGVKERQDLIKDIAQNYSEKADDFLKPSVIEALEHFVFIQNDVRGTLSIFKDKGKEYQNVVAAFDELY